MTTRWPELHFADEIWTRADERPGAAEVRRAVRDTAARMRPGDPQDLVGAIQSARRCQEHIDELLVVLVAEARSQGTAWSAIGPALGIGRTAAQKRFGSRLHSAHETIRSQHRRQIEIAREVMENIHLQPEQRVDMYERFLERSGYFTAAQLDETTPELNASERRD